MGLILPLGGRTTISLYNNAFSPPTQFPLSLELDHMEKATEDVIAAEVIISELLCTANALCAAYQHRNGSAPAIAFAIDQQKKGPESSSLCKRMSIK